MNKTRVDLHGRGFVSLDFEAAGRHFALCCRESKDSIDAAVMMLRLLR